jgi:hypothetical protein
MTQTKEPRNTFFNFRIRPEELNQIKEATIKYNFVSYAEFIRAAIREKIKRDAKNEQ